MHLGSITDKWDMSKIMAVSISKKSNQTQLASMISMISNLKIRRELGWILALEYTFQMWLGSQISIIRPWSEKDNWFSRSNLELTRFNFLGSPSIFMAPTLITRIRIWDGCSSDTEVASKVFIGSKISKITRKFGVIHELPDTSKFVFQSMKAKVSPWSH